MDNHSDIDNYTTIFNSYVIPNIPDIFPLYSHYIPITLW